MTMFPYDRYDRPPEPHCHHDCPCDECCAMRKRNEPEITLTRGSRMIKLADGEYVDVVLRSELQTLSDGVDKLIISACTRLDKIESDLNLIRGAIRGIQITLENEIELNKVV